MLALPQLYHRVAQLPPVPSRTLDYKGTVTHTGPEDTTVFTGCDIGVPHPQRVIVLSVYHGVGVAAFALVNGTPHVGRRQTPSHEGGLHVFNIPNGTTADITLTAAGSLDKAVSWYVCYPRHWQDPDSGAASANAGTDAVTNDIKVVAGGWLIYAGVQAITLGTHTVTWGGADTVTEDVDAQIGGSATYSMGHIDITESSDANDLTLAASVNGTKRIACITIQPPPP